MPATISESLKRYEYRTRNKARLGDAWSASDALPTATAPTCGEPITVASLVEASQLQLEGLTRGWWRCLDAGARAAVVSAARYPKLLILYYPQTDWLEIDLCDMTDADRAIVQDRIGRQLPPQHSLVFLDGPSERPDVFRQLSLKAADRQNTFVQERFLHPSGQKAESSGLSPSLTSTEESVTNIELHLLSEFASAGHKNLMVSRALCRSPREAHEIAVVRFRAGARRNAGCSPICGQKLAWLSCCLRKTCFRQSYGFLLHSARQM